MDLPEKIGPYRILELLGAGSAGVVYRAERVEGGPQAAVKTVRLPREAMVDSLRREIHALARLRHPGIVRMFDEGLDGGIPWYAMELVEGGRTLRDRLSEGPLPLSGALSLARRLCTPLAFLHGEGLVHRDLKPENVLVRTGAGAASRDVGMPVIMDFGVAARFIGQTGRETLQIGEGLTGTVAYMAPEQIRGEPVDARADLYSLGCVLYELVTHQVPFHGTTLAQLVRQHMGEEPVAPSRRVAEIDPRLDELVLRLLAKNPRDRYGHAGAVAEALAGLGAKGMDGDHESRPRSYLYRPGFAGRDEPLHMMTELVRRLASGTGGVVSIGGESGVGKTRLLIELARQTAKLEVQVFSGQSEAISSIGTSTQTRNGDALHPLKHALRSIGDRCREQGNAVTERLLGPRIKVLALYEPTLATLPEYASHPEPVELSAEAARARLFRCLTETFSALGAQQPVLLMLDDLQWADDLTLGWLRFVLRGQLRENARMLIVTAFRSEEVDDALRPLLDAPELQHLALSRLDESAVGSMVGDMLAVAPPPSVFVHYLSKHSEGNPFFVAEYLRAAVEEGLLYRDAVGSWQVAEESEADATEAAYAALPLPGSVRDLVGQRLARVSAGAGELAMVAAVLGREVDQRLLSDVSGLDAEPMMEFVHELITRQLMEDAGPGRLRFVHDKIREVAYERIGEAERIGLHRAAAEVIERADESTKHAELSALGHHWEQAGAPEKARACYLSAARISKSRYAQVEAERLYRAYLRLVEQPTAESVDARVEFSHVLWTHGRHREIVLECEKSIAESRQISEPRLETKILPVLGWAHYSLGQFDSAKPIYEQAIHAAREAGDRHMEGRGLAGLGVLHSRQGRMAQGRDLLESALKIAFELENESLESLVLANLGGIHQQQGRIDEAGRLWGRALAIARKVGHRPNEGTYLGNLAIVHAQNGQNDDARAAWEQAIAIARELGDRANESNHLANLASFLGDQGQLNVARALYEQALAANREVGDRRVEGVSLTARARLERQSGQLADAQHSLDVAESLLRQVGEGHHLALALCERGFLLLAKGMSAREAFEEAEEMTVRLQAGPESTVRRALAKLQRATDASNAGRPLLQGECPEDLPEALRRTILLNARRMPRGS